MQTVKRIATLLIICLHIGTGYTQTNNCGLQKFQCHNGECINDELLCDGAAHCKDWSDETEAECTKTVCPDYAFRCNYGACINGDSVCNGIQDCVDNSDETEPHCKTTRNQTQSYISQSTQRSHLITTHSIKDCRVPSQLQNGYWKLHRSQCPNKKIECDIPQATEVKIGSHLVYSCNPGYKIRGPINVRCKHEGRWSNIPVCIGIKTIKTTRSIKNCRVPPQPQNGYWKLHRSQCSNRKMECDVPQETKEMRIKSHLVYSCNPGFKIKGPINVHCTPKGTWSNIPVCIDTRCPPLTSMTTDATCTYNNQEVSCKSPVLPNTMASLTCRNNYQPAPNHISKDKVRCNAIGEWKPQPIRCIPVCGKLPADVTPLIVGGVRANIAEFPWHASMYYDEPGEPKKYFCGASIIQENLLLTAAHCVYDNTNGRVTDKTIYIVTGNLFRDYNSPIHNSHFVKKNQVKNIYIMCDYIGQIGNYMMDIAILELVEPFVLSPHLIPVCIDSSNNELEIGAFGKVAGFGRTEVSKYSGVLQALTVPYIPYHQCRTASLAAKMLEFSIVDKFCAGNSNGSSVCEGDSGSGLVFEKEGIWYLRGIVSISLGVIKNGGNIHCDNMSYSLYTRVSVHMQWIQDVITILNQNQTYPSCQEKVPGEYTDTQGISYKILSKILKVSLKCPFNISPKFIIPQIYNRCSWQVQT